MGTRFQRTPPVVHWCEVCDEYLNIPVDRDESGRSIGECPYCGEMIWEETDKYYGWKGGEGEPYPSEPGPDS